MTSSARTVPDELLQRFLDEDLGPGDVTTRALVPPDARGRARLIAKQDGVLSGLQVARRVFELCDPGCTLETELADGATLTRGDTVARLAGPAAALLAAERTALNLLQRMSGIATLTRRYVEAVAGTRALILETRKTAPGLRLLDKQAVLHGGGHNHRMGLHDQVLIKENHIAMLAADPGVGRPLEAAIERARAAVPAGMVVEVEVLDAAEARRAATAGADVVLLDNFPVDEVRRVVADLRDFPRVELEASGGIQLANVAEFAATGVHRISIGALTHSVPALDLSLLFEVPDP